MSEQRKGRMQRIAPLDEVGITVVSERDTTVTEFRPRYLKSILQRVFSDKYQLANFSANILRLERSSLDNLMEDELTDKIIDAFEHSDRITQSVFMQALQSRTRDIQSSEFDKYFRAWEKQISK
jgi:hypothetical protein